LILNILPCIELPIFSYKRLKQVRCKKHTIKTHHLAPTKHPPAQQDKTHPKQYLSTDRKQMKQQPKNTHPDSLPVHTTSPRTINKALRFPRFELLDSWDNLDGFSSEWDKPLDISFWQPSQLESSDIWQ
jgi:hypothetical protein